MNEYWKHKKTGVMYRIWENDKTFHVYHLQFTQYFDGLWEIETKEQLIAEVKTKAEAEKTIINHAKEFKKLKNKINN